MKTQPERMTVCNIECLLMPNGEVIVLGKTVGMFDKLKNLMRKEPAGTPKDLHTPVEVVEQCLTRWGGSGDFTVDEFESWEKAANTIIEELKAEHGRGTLHMPGYILKRKIES